MAVPLKRKTLSRVLPGIIFILLALPFANAFCAFDLKVNETALEQAVAEGKLPSDILQGTRVVCFYSMICPYCEKNAKRLERTRTLLHLKDAPLTVVFGRPETPRDPKPFFDATGLQYDTMTYADQDVFLDIVCGKWPLVVVLKDGRVFHKFTYRGF